MKNELVKLDSRDILGRTVTVFGTAENPLFLAKDVAEWIEHKDVTSMLRNIDEEEKLLLEGYTFDSAQSAESGNLRTNRWFLMENGLYEVLFLSRKPIAKEFKREVKKLLHDLRTGKKEIKSNLSGLELIVAGYSEAMKQIKEQQKVIAFQEEKIELDKPKVLFSDAVATSNTDILIGDLAKILRQNGIDIGQNRLFEYLRNSNYLCRKGSRYNTPSQRAMDLGLFRIKETVITQGDGTIIVNKTSKVTGKGQQYFVNKFLNNPIRD